MGSTVHFLCGVAVTLYTEVVTTRFKVKIDLGPGFPIFLPCVFVAGKSRGADTQILLHMLVLSSKYHRFGLLELGCTQLRALFLALAAAGFADADTSTHGTAGRCRKGEDAPLVQITEVFDAHAGSPAVGETGA